MHSEFTVVLDVTPWSLIVGFRGIYS